jgi:hypothetical protein
MLPLPVSTAKLIGKFYSSVTIGKARRTGVRAVPILLYPLHCANTIGAAVHTLLIGEAQRIWKICKYLIIGAAKVPRFA